MLDLQATLESRYPDFFARHQRVGRTLIRSLNRLFRVQRFADFGQRYPHLQGLDFVEQALEYFDFSFKVRDRERARIPASGRVVIVANHPIGSLDGLALLHLVSSVRTDVKVVANDLLTAIEPLRPLLLPVNNLQGGTPRGQLRRLREHLQAEGALIIFPAGEVSRFGPTGIRDGAWQSGFVSLARATRSPVLPVHVGGRNSLFFYGLSILARPLSTLWLVREMFHQRHNAVEVRLGRPVPWEHYSAIEGSPKHLARLFRRHLYRLPRNARPVFDSIDTVAAPENRILLRRELALSENLGRTQDGKSILLVRAGEAPCVMRELGRLRELTFRTVGEGTGKPRDLDRHDRDYLQLVLWDDRDLEIAGAYRLGDSAALLQSGGPEALYSHSLFSFGPGMQPLLAAGLELGRSFVQPRYQNRQALDYLWQGIGAFLRRYPRFRYLYGPVSISRLYGEETIQRIARYYAGHYRALPLDVRARNPLPGSKGPCPGEAPSEDLAALKTWLAEQGLGLPTLFKHYAQVAEADGIGVGPFNVDPLFGDCVDALVVVDLTRLKPAKRRRYLGEATLPD
ncbi:bifunctional ornithine lipid synthase OlsF [Haliea atlantica]